MYTWISRVMVLVFSLQLLVPQGAYAQLYEPQETYDIGYDTPYRDNLYAITDAALQANIERNKPIQFQRRELDFPADATRAAYKLPVKVNLPAKGPAGIAPALLDAQLAMESGLRARLHKQLEDLLHEKPLAGETLDAFFQRRLDTLADIYDTLDVGNDQEMHNALYEVVAAMHQLAQDYAPFHTSTLMANSQRHVPVRGSTQTITVPTPMPDSIPGPKHVYNTGDGTPADPFIQAISEQFAQKLQAETVEDDDVVELMDPLFPQLKPINPDAQFPEGWENDLSRGATASYAATRVMSAYGAEMMVHRLNVLLMSPELSEEDAEFWTDFLPRLQARVRYRYDHTPSIIENPTWDVIMLKSALRVLLYKIHLMYNKIGLTDPTTTVYSKETVTTLPATEKIVRPTRAAYQKYVAAFRKHADQMALLWNNSAAERLTAPLPDAPNLNPMPFDEFQEKFTLRISMFQEIPTGYEEVPNDPSANGQDAAEQTTYSAVNIFSDMNEHFLGLFMRELDWLLGSEPDTPEYAYATLLVEAIVNYALTIGKPEALKEVIARLDVPEEDKDDIKFPTDFNIKHNDLLQTVFVSIVGTLKDGGSNLNIIQRSKELLVELSGPDYNTTTRIQALGAAGLLNKAGLWKEKDGNDNSEVNKALAFSDEDREKLVKYAADFYKNLNPLYNYNQNPEWLKSFGAFVTEQRSKHIDAFNFNPNKTEKIMASMGEEELREAAREYQRAATEALSVLPTYGLDAKQAVVLQDQLVANIHNLLPVQAPKRVWVAQHGYVADPATLVELKEIPEEKDKKVSNATTTSLTEESQYTFAKPVFVFDSDGKIVTVYKHNIKNPALVAKDLEKRIQVIFKEAAIWVIGGEIFELAFNFLRLARAVVVMLPKAFKASYKSYRSLRKGGKSAAQIQKAMRGRFSAKIRQGVQYGVKFSQSAGRAGIQITAIQGTKTVSGKAAQKTLAKANERLAQTEREIDQVTQQVADVTDPRQAARLQKKLNRLQEKANQLRADISKITNPRDAAAKALNKQAEQLEEKAQELRTKSEQLRQKGKSNRNHTLRGRRLEQQAADLDAQAQALRNQAQQILDGTADYVADVSMSERGFFRRFKNRDVRPTEWTAHQHRPGYDVRDTYIGANQYAGELNPGSWRNMLDNARMRHLLQQQGFNLDDMVKLFNGESFMGLKLNPLARFQVRREARMLQAVQDALRKGTLEKTFVFMNEKGEQVSYEKMMALLNNKNAEERLLAQSKVRELLGLTPQSSTSEIQAALDKARQEFDALRPVFAGLEDESLNLLREQLELTVTNQQAMDVIFDQLFTRASQLSGGTSLERVTEAARLLEQSATPGTKGLYNFVKNKSTEIRGQLDGMLRNQTLPFARQLGPDTGINEIRQRYHFFEDLFKAYEDAMMPSYYAMPKSMFPGKTVPAGFKPDPNNPLVLRIQNIDNEAFNAILRNKVPPFSKFTPPATTLEETLAVPFTNYLNNIRNVAGNGNPLGLMFPYYLPKRPKSGLMSRFASNLGLFGTFAFTTDILFYKGFEWLGNTRWEGQYNRENNRFNTSWNREKQLAGEETDQEREWNKEFQETMSLASRVISKRHTWDYSFGMTFAIMPVMLPFTAYGLIQNPFTDKDRANIHARASQADVNYWKVSQNWGQAQKDAAAMLTSLRDQFSRERQLDKEGQFTKEIDAILAALDKAEQDFQQFANDPALSIGKKYSKYAEWIKMTEYSEAVQAYNLKYWGQIVAQEPQIWADVRQNFEDLLAQDTEGLLTAEINAVLAEIDKLERSFNEIIVGSDDIPTKLTAYSKLAEAPAYSSALEKFYAKENELYVSGTLQGLDQTLRNLQTELDFQFISQDEFNANTQLIEQAKQKLLEIDKSNEKPSVKYIQLQEWSLNYNISTEQLSVAQTREIYQEKLKDSTDSSLRKLYTSALQTLDTLETSLTRLASGKGDLSERQKEFEQWQFDQQVFIARSTQEEARLGLERQLVDLAADRLSTFSLSNTTDATAAQLRTMLDDNQQYTALLERIVASQADIQTKANLLALWKQPREALYLSGLSYSTIQSQYQKVKQELAFLTDDQTVRQNWVDNKLEELNEYLGTSMPLEKYAFLSQSLAEMTESGTWNDQQCANLLSLWKQSSSITTVYPALPEAQKAEWAKHQADTQLLYQAQNGYYAQKLEKYGEEALEERQQLWMQAQSSLNATYQNKVLSTEQKIEKYKSIVKEFTVNMRTLWNKYVTAVSQHNDHTELLPDEVSPFSPLPY